jgi:hypothetical protein
MHDLFEQLADVEVPPLPENFEHGLHDRVNNILLLSHVVEFACKACGYACGHFAAALWELMIFTLSGRFRVVRNTSDQGDSTNPAP